MPFRHLPCPCSSVDIGCTIDSNSTTNKSSSFALEGCTTKLVEVHVGFDLPWLLFKKFSEMGFLKTSVGMGSPTKRGAQNSTYCMT